MGEAPEFMPQLLVGQFSHREKLPVNFASGNISISLFNRRNLSGHSTLIALGSTRRSLRKLVLLAGLDFQHLLKVC